MTPRRASFFLSYFLFPGLQGIDLTLALREDFPSLKWTVMTAVLPIMDHHTSQGPHAHRLDRLWDLQPQIALRSRQRRSGSIRPGLPWYGHICPATRVMDIKNSSTELRRCREAVLCTELKCSTHQLTYKMSLANKVLVNRSHTSPMDSSPMAQCSLLRLSLRCTKRCPNTSSVSQLQSRSCQVN